MATLLANVESMSIALRTPGGRALEYRTSLIDENDEVFTIHVSSDLWDQLVPGDTVQIKASLPSGFLLFETEIIALDEEPVPHATLAAAPSGKVRRIPRRQHFRVAAILPVTFRFERAGARLPEQLVALVARTFDVSAGGVGVVIDGSRQLVLPTSHTTGRIELTLTPLEPWVERTAAPPVVVECAARVVRIDAIPDTPMIRFGIDFQDITEHQRTDLAGFVMAHQLALRRRGVLR